MDMFGGTIVDRAIWLVGEILKARRELHNAPQKLLALVQQVEHAQVVLLKVQQSGAHEEVAFQNCLRDLGEQLLCAQDKLHKYTQQAQKPKNEVLEIAKSSLGQGAAKQNQKTEALRERIRTLLEQLNQLLSAKTGCQLITLSEAVDHSHSVNTDTNTKITVLSKRVVLLQGVMDDTNLKVTTLEKALSQHTLHPKTALVVVPPLILKLNKLERACCDDEECTIVLEICEDNAHHFHPPLEEMDHNIAVGIEDRNQRAAEKGGYQIANRTKVRFTMDVEENRYFYVIMYDALEDSDPSLYFPEYASDKNQITRMFKRVFPDHTRFRCDPPHMVISKSGHLSTDAIGRHNIYIVLSRSKLHSDTGEQLPLRDIIDNIEDKDFVRRFVFDIK
eukprot:c14634_g1_i2 orf=219-1388(+)